MPIQYIYLLIIQQRRILNFPIWEENDIIIIIIIRLISLFCSIHSMRIITKITQ